MSNKHTKNDCNRTILVQVIAEDVVAYFFFKHGVLDALLDGQPMQVLEYRCHMVAPVRLRDDASERVLDALQLLDVGDFGAVEQRLAVVEPGADDAASDGVRYFTVQQWSDVPQRSNVEVAGLHDALYMLVEGQALVEWDSKALQCL